MVLGDADRLGTAGDAVTRWNTLPGGRTAGLLLRALGVRQTLIPGYECAARPVLGIPCVAFQTLAEALVVAGPALGVGRTVEERADRDALQNAK
jgi:hypothetical protein